MRKLYTDWQKVVKFLPLRIPFLQLPYAFYPRFMHAFPTFALFRAMANFSPAPLQTARRPV